MDAIKVAIIGYGHLGKWHATKVEKSGKAKLYAIVESFPTNQDAAKIAHPQAKVVSSIDEVMHEIDAAFVVTPTSVHASLVQKLLAANKHVFCEKPLTSELIDAQKISTLVRDSKLVLQVGHSERFHEAWEIIQNKYPEYLKAPVTMRIARYAPFKGRATDVDVVSDVMIHDMDLMVFLLQDKPKFVEASGLKIRTSKWDHALCHFTFKSGSVVSILSSRNHVKEVREVEITSHAGCLYLDLMTCEMFFAPKDKTSQGEYVEKIAYNKRDHLQLEHDAFYNAILGLGKIPVTAHDGVYAVQMIDAALQSMESGEKVMIS
ncbi:MAG: Gfo/Idh/MocA family protein [Bacteriovoracaceae bacterium]